MRPLNGEMTPLEKAQQRIDNWIQQGDVTQPLDLVCLNLTTFPELPPTLQILDCSRKYFWGKFRYCYAF